MCSCLPQLIIGYKMSLAFEAVCLVFTIKYQYARQSHCDLINYVRSRGEGHGHTHESGMQIKAKDKYDTKGMQGGPLAFD
jgi:hypothetical protein